LYNLSEFADKFRALVIDKKLASANHIYLILTNFHLKY